jgi:NRPS condensation-like uncharacterized protein
VQYKLFLVPDFQADKSLVILKSHHVLSDGLGFASLFLAISDVYDPNCLPAMKPLPLAKKFIINLLLPFLVLRSSLTMLFTFKNHNVIKKNLKNSGVKNGAFYENLDITKIKVKCKQNSCTVNDFMMSVLSVTFYEYF